MYIYRIKTSFPNKTFSYRQSVPSPCRSAAVTQLPGSRHLIANTDPQSRFFIAPYRRYTRATLA